MRRFVKKLSIYLSLLAGIFIILTLVTRLNREKVIDYKIPSDKHIVLIGNSMTECAFNDSIDTPVINLSKSAKQYLFCKIDIENLIKENPQIDTILMCASYVSINPNADEEYYNSAYLEYVNYYAPYMGIGDFIILPERLPHLRALIAGNALRESILHTNVPGAYLYNTRDNLERSKKEHNKTKNKRVILTDKTRVPKITDLVLKDIISFCQQKGIELIFVNPPEYIGYEDINNSQYVRDYLSSQLGIDVSKNFWDYSNYQLPDSCYADIIHLNHRGAAIFTEVLSARLSKENIK